MWRILDQGAVKFTRDTTTGFRGNNCIVAPINSTVAIGQRFQLVSPGVDLRPLVGKNPKISMMIGYLRQNTTSSEDFRLHQSKGCDYSWNQFLSKITKVPPIRQDFVFYSFPILHSFNRTNLKNTRVYHFVIVPRV